MAFESDLRLTLWECLKAHHLVISFVNLITSHLALVIVTPRVFFTPVEVLSVPLFIAELLEPAAVVPTDRSVALLCFLVADGSVEPDIVLEVAGRLHFVITSHVEVFLIVSRLHPVMEHLAIDHVGEPFIALDQTLIIERALVQVHNLDVLVSRLVKVNIMFPRIVVELLPQSETACFVKLVQTFVPYNFTFPVKSIFFLVFHHHPVNTVESFPQIVNMIHKKFVCQLFVRKVEERARHFFLWQAALTQDLDRFSPVLVEKFDRLELGLVFLVKQVVVLAELEQLLPSRIRDFARYFTKLAHALNAVFDLVDADHGIVVSQGNPGLRFDVFRVVSVTDRHRWKCRPYRLGNFLHLGLTCFDQRLLEILHLSEYVLHVGRSLVVFVAVQGPRRLRPQ